MSDSDSEREDPTNNQLPPPSSPIQDQTQHGRHPEYYYEDGSVVFLAGEVLFKIYAPRLAADPGVEDYEFKALMRGVLDNSDTSTNKLGSDDMNPVILPNVTAVQFTRFLSAVLGRLGDRDFMSFISAASNPPNHTPLLLVRLADTGTLAARFGMNALDSWVNSQLLLIPRRSPLVSLTENQEQPVLWSIITYIQTTRAMTSRNELWAWVEFAISCYLDATRDQTPGSLNVFVDWYRDRSWLESSPRLLGYLFAVILSLGHLSTIWNDALTRGERRVFYAAHAVLTRLCDHADLGVEWLTQPTLVKDVCSQPTCARIFDDCWKTSFGRCKKLHSSVALEDIRQILRLPRFRFGFADQSKDWNCESQCAQKTLVKIDGCIGQVFLRLAAKQEFFARTA